MEQRKVLLWKRLSFYRQILVCRELSYDSDQPGFNFNPKLFIFPMPMERLKALIRNFFAFSKRRPTLFNFIARYGFVDFSEPIYRYFFARQKQDFSQDQAKLDSLVATLNDSVNVEAEPAINLKLFDPNTATQPELVSLGFSDAFAKRLINYRSKGAKFILKRTF